MKAETTPSLYARKLIDVLNERGIDYRCALRSSGLTARELLESERELKLAKYLRLVNCLVEIVDIPELGFLVGESTRLQEHGTLGYALLSSRKFASSLRRYIRYQSIVGPLLNVEFEARETGAVMIANPRHDFGEISEAAHRYFLQEWLATWNPWCALLGLRPPFFESVSLPQSEASLGSLYRYHLGCEISFASGPAKVRFPLTHLDCKLRFTDPQTGAFCREQCELLLQAQIKNHGLTAELHRQFALQPGAVPNMESVAKRLCMTSRTLRRRLLAERTTFQDTVVQHRIALAKRFLGETRLPVNEIVELVGYADPANFYKTFRRIEGSTPGQFRKRILRRSTAL